MHNQNKAQSSLWRNQVKQILAEKTPYSFFAHDATGTPIILEYEVFDPTAPQFSERIKGLAPILVETYATAELEFARAYPERIPTEWFLQSIAPLFSQGVDKVDWQKADEQLKTFLHNFFTTTNFSIFSKPDDIVILVIAKNKETNRELGLIQFIISSEYEAGDIKAGFFGVTKNSLNHGLEELLMCTIFKLLPQVKRIFLHARITNTDFLSNCFNMGFKKFTGPLEYWTDLEYKTDQEKILKTKAESVR